MSNFSKIVILIILVLSFFFIKEKYGENINNTISFFKNKGQIELPEIPTEKQEIVRPSSEQTEQSNEKVSVAVYFLALDSNDNGIFKKVQRDLPQNTEKLEFAIKELLKGPNLIEKSMGAYSEIPTSTKLLKIKQTGKKVIIDFNSDFQYGGGTDSIYSRMMQLIKTAVANTDKKQIYLHLDGKQVNVIGGEGVMITQPLTEKSLDF